MCYGGINLIDRKKSLKQLWFWVAGCGLKNSDIQGNEVKWFELLKSSNNCLMNYHKPDLN